MKGATSVASSYWASIFTPLWIGLLFLLLADRDWPDFTYKFHSDWEDYESLERYWDTFWTNSVIAVIVFLVLEALKLDGVVSWSHYITFIPFWYLGFIWANMMLTEIIAGKYRAWESTFAVIFGSLYW
jgi:hypothetical protein